MKHRLICTFLIVALISTLHINWAIAQTQDELIDIVVATSSSSTIVGEEFTLTLTVKGGDMPPCTSATAQAADVVLVIDLSSSMDDYNKLEGAKQAALTFLAQMDPSIDQVAIVGFSDHAFTAQSLTSDMEQARTAVNELDFLNGTQIASGLREATQILVNSPRHLSANAVIVLLSDGRSDVTDTLHAAEEARAQGIGIYAVSLGDDADRQLMEDITTSASNYYHAPTATELNQIYRLIQTQIAYVRAEDVTLEAEINAAAMELIPNSASVAGAVTRNRVNWEIGELSPGEEQSLSFRLRALQSGNHHVFSQFSAHLQACNEPYDLTPDIPNLTFQPPYTPTPGPKPISTCNEEPLENECISTLFFLGELTWPCRELGLPWWICVLLPLLFLLSLLLWWLWRRIERQRRSWSSPRYSPPQQQGVDSSTWPPLPTPQEPPFIPVINPQVESQLNPALVIGVGRLGQTAIEALQETLHKSYSKVSDKIRLLSIGFAETVEQQEWTSVALPLHQDVLSQLAQRDLRELPDWLPSDIDFNVFGERTSLSERALGRLAVFVKRRELEAYLAKELENFARSTFSIFLVGSLAEGNTSGALFDLGYLIRQQLKQSTMSSYSLQGLVFLPEAHVEAFLNLNEQFTLQRTAASAWRELDRFQSIFEYAYPVDYLGKKTQYDGKLFDRCYLLSPERSGGPALTDRAAVNTLCPAVADMILSFSDSAFQPVWEETARAVTNRVGHLQVERNEVLYSSLGSFTHILPVEDLMMAIALQMADDMVGSQLSEGIGDSEQMALQLLSQPRSDTGVLTTHLMHDVAQCAPLPDEQVLDHLSHLGVEAFTLLSVGQESEAQQAYLETLHRLISGGVLESVQTSAEIQAAEYGPDTLRLLQEVDRTFDQLKILAQCMAGYSEDQARIFKRILVEKFITILNSDRRDGEGGVKDGLALSQSLLSILTRYQHALTKVRDEQMRLLEELKRDKEDLRESLQRNASGSRARHPNFWKALLVGVVPSAIGVVGLGLVTLAVPQLSIPLLGGVALLATSVGVWGSWRVLNRKPALIQQQEQYLEIAQDIFALEIESRLYSAWKRVIDRWVEIAHSVTAPLQGWKSMWESMELQRILVDKKEQLGEKRAGRHAISVRHYLEDDQIQKALYEQYIAPRVKEDENRRFLWVFEEGENDQVDWSLEVFGSNSKVLKSSGTEKAVEALLELGLAYASELRSLYVADVLADNYSSSAIAEEVSSASAPFIRISANEQPLSESHRFVAAASKSQQTYFDEMIKALRQPAARSHSEQLAMLTHPHRCVTLVSLNLLRNAGLPSWNQERSSYTNLRRRERAALQVFPAERHTALYEGLLPSIGLSGRIFSPQTALTLEDERRARAFWKAYALGWVREVGVDDGGFSTLRQMTLTMPGARPILLTNPTPEGPSLWHAVVSFVLGSSGGDVQAIETAVNTLKPSNAQERHASENLLIQALDKAKEMQQQTTVVTQEMGLIMHLVIEDLLREWLDEEGFLEV